MMTFSQYMAEASMKPVAPGIAVPVPSKPAAKGKAPGPLVPPAKPKASDLKPLTFVQALEKSAQISAFAQVAADELDQSRARKAVDREREKDAKETRQPTRPTVPPQGF